MSELGWPTVRAALFTETEGVYWRDGKPWCERHHVVVVPCSRLGLVTYEDDEHVCHVCARESEAASPSAARQASATTEGDG